MRSWCLTQQKQNQLWQHGQLECIYCIRPSMLKKVDARWCREQHLYAVASNMQSQMCFNTTPTHLQCQSAVRYWCQAADSHPQQPAGRLVAAADAPLPP